MYVYVRSEPSLWTVGFYAPDGKWEPESDHASSDEAARRVMWLNGSGRPDADLMVSRIQDALMTAEEGDALVEVARNAHRAEMELANMEREAPDA